MFRESLILTSQKMHHAMHIGLVASFSVKVATYKEYQKLQHTFQNALSADTPKNLCTLLENAVSTAENIARSADEAFNAFLASVACNSFFLPGFDKNTLLALIEDHCANNEHIKVLSMLVDKLLSSTSYAESAEKPSMLF